MRTSYPENWREDSIKTRIETKESEKDAITWKIEEKIPLKQGLKHNFPCFQPCQKKNWREDSIKTRIETEVRRGEEKWLENWREDSIKTRIETLVAPCRQKVHLHWREDSIKTRIETFWIRGCNRGRIQIEEKIPLKQGLKPKACF